MKQQTWREPEQYLRLPRQGDTKSCGDKEIQSKTFIPPSSRNESVLIKGMTQQVCRVTADRLRQAASNLMFLIAFAGIISVFHSALYAAMQGTTATVRFQLKRMKVARVKEGKSSWVSRG